MEDMTPWYTGQIDSQGRNRKGTKKRQLSLLEPYIYYAAKESLGEVIRWQAAGSWWQL